MLITARLSIECVFIAFGHLNAALLITNGVDVKTVQTCLGHSEATTTQEIYTHSFTAANIRANKIIEEMLSDSEETDENEE